MTEIISSLALPHLGRNGLDLFSESADYSWEQPYLEPLAMLSAAWPQGPGSQISGMQPLDVRFDSESQGYFNPHHVPSPHIGYPVSDMGTPSSHGPQDAGEPYHGPHVSGMHLYPNHGPGTMHSPHSSISAISPQHTPLESPPAVTYNGKPQLARLNSAPEPGDIKTTRSNKHRGSSEEEDENYSPGTKRGRKRQRIPHTAVERRYRENLNAHLEKLRQTVPTLAARKGAAGGKGDGEGVKPSKCEILHSAIEFIGAREKDIAAKDKRIADLTADNAALRANLEQMRNWIRANSR